MLRDAKALEAIVFPAHAGMSRHHVPLLNRMSCFPRSRGDEPMPNGVEFNTLTFSPLTRG